MRRLALLAAAAILLIGSTATAFFTGAYFEQARLVAGITAWALVLLVAAIGPRPLPSQWPGWTVVGALVVLTAWTGASVSWAPMATPAVDDVQRLLLYVAVLLAAIGLLRMREVARALEPVLALGIVVVIGYGLAGRLVPGIVELSRSAGAFGRLEQPITYWNAEGALAAIGLVLCARLIGDRSRPLAMRALSAAACAPLGMGVYLSYSRGAIAAAVVGLVVLLAAAPTRDQLRAIGLALVSGVVAGACSSAFAGVASLSGSAADRERDGAIMLAILLVLMAAVSVAAAWDARRAPAQAHRLSFAGSLPALAAVAVAIAVAGLFAGGLGERGERSSERLATASPSRLTTVSSRRYDYWRIGLDAFAAHPLRGVGAGGFRAEWLRERPVKEAVREAHSLELGIAAELGLPGLLALLAALGGVGVAARRALRAERPLAAGCAAASTVWILHASIDWDWEIPAVTLPVIVMAGALIAASEADPSQTDEDAEAASAPAGHRHAVEA